VTTSLPTGNRQGNEVHPKLPLGVGGELHRILYISNQGALRIMRDAQARHGWGRGRACEILSVIRRSVKILAPRIRLHYRVE